MSEREGILLMWDLATFWFYLSLEHPIVEKRSYALSMSWKYSDKLPRGFQDMNNIALGTLE